MGSTPYFIIFALYAIGMALVGIYLYRKEKKNHTGTGTLNTNFWCANRTLPFWQAGISLAAGWMMLGWVGLGIQQIYLQGAAGLWVLPIPWFILIFLIMVIIPYIRRLRTVSLPRALLHRFGKPCAIVVGISSLFIFVSWMGAELFMAGNLMAPFLQIPPVFCMTLFVLPIMLYMTLGGFRAIVLTDVLQFILMSVFMIILAVTALHLAADVAGDRGILDTLRTTPTTTYGENSMFSLFACGRILPMILLVAYLPGWLFEQDLTLRIFSCKSLKESYKGIAFGGTIHIIFTLILPVIVAFCAILIFPEASENSPIGKDALNIVPAIIQKGCSPILQLVMFLGIIAVQMSTVDSFANVSAMAVTHDIAEPFFKKPFQRISQLRMLSVLAVLMGLVYAFFAESLYALYTLSSGVLTASVALPMVVLFFKKTKPLAALLTAIFGLLGNLLFFIYEYYICMHDYAPQWLAETYVGYIVVGIAMALVGGLIGQIIGKPPTAEQLESISETPHDGVDHILDDKIL